ncbi:MAG: hypothetical protein Q9200_001402 [Gallowayella weberi]
MFAMLSLYANAFESDPLLRYFSSFRYTPFVQSRLEQHTLHYLNSKRRAGLAFSVLSVLSLLATFYLATPIISRSQVGGSQDRFFESLPERVIDAVDWSRFAYIQYATNKPYLCNSIMLFEALHRLGGRAERLLMYPSKFHLTGEDGTESQSWENGLLRKARDEYNVKLKPIEVVARDSNEPKQATWAESYTKLLAFNQTQYARVLHLDSDATVLQTMDELFLLPPVPLAMPRAYWMNASDRVMSSQLLLIKPSKLEFPRVPRAIEGSSPNEFDMDLVKNHYRDNALILPHRPYNMLMAEYRNTGNHKAYMGSEEEPFDPEKALKEAKFLHFSDWPVPKVKSLSLYIPTTMLTYKQPWLPTADHLQKTMPPCIPVSNTNNTDCRQQKMWLGFYDDFAQRRKAVCTENASPSRKRRWVKRVIDLDPTYEPYFE